MRLRRQQKRIERSAEKHHKKTGTKRIGTIRAACAKMTSPLFCVANILHKNHNPTYFTTKYFLLSFFYNKPHDRFGSNASILKIARTL